MNGTVDNAWRALLRMSLRNPINGATATFDAWVDTGFNGDLILPRGQVASLDLTAGYSIRALLADGSEVEVKTYAGETDWFGARRPTEVIANDGMTPLLGTGMLRGRELHTSYRQQTMKLD